MITMESLHPRMTQTTIASLSIADLAFNRNCENGEVPGTAFFQGGACHQYADKKVS